MKIAIAFLSLTLAFASRLQIITASLPPGTVGVAYSAQLSASGGVPPYRWAVSAGQLPTGLTLAASGLISGMPSTSGSTSLAIKVMDSSGVSRSYTISIAPAAPPPPSNVLWTAGMETGTLSEWYYPATGPSGDYGGGEYNSGLADSVASTEQAHTGSWSAKMTITTPNSPSSGTRLFRWRESQTYPALYYSAWFYIPTLVTPREYWNVFQFKSKHAAGVDPFFVLNVGNRTNGAMYLYLWDWQRSRQYDQTLKDVPVGQWFQIEAFYQCAPDSTGRVTFWQDGSKLFDIGGLSTRYSDGDCQWSVDNYSNGLTPNTVTIYVDDASIRQP